MNDLHIGVIGVGGRGSLARHAHRPGEGSRVVACCDVSEAMLTRGQERYGNDIFTTNDVDELLAHDLDAVFICTPDWLHEGQAVAALEAGKAVYLEKPMAITTAGCDRILETAARLNGRLYLGHNMRHMTFVQQMKTLIDEGAIGEVKTAWCRHFVGHGGDFYFKDWHADRRNTTGMLLQKAAHDIDVLHWLCGGYATRVNALGGLTVYGDIPSRQNDTTDQPAFEASRAASAENWPPLSQTGLYPIIDIEDVSMMQMELDNGVFAAYQQCHFTPDYWRNYTIIGTEGRIENFGDTQPNAVVKLWNTRVNDYNPDADETFAVGATAANHGGADSRIVAEFVRYAREGGAVMTSPLAARHSVAAGCGATESLRNGGVPVEIAGVTDEVVSYFPGWIGPLASLG